MKKLLIIGLLISMFILTMTMSSAYVLTPLYETSNYVDATTSKEYVNVFNQDYYFYTYEVSPNVYKNCQVRTNHTDNSCSYSSDINITDISTYTNPNYLYYLVSDYNGLRVHQAGSTLGGTSSSPIPYPITIFNNDYTGITYFGNKTHLETSEGNFLLPSELQNKTYKADVYNNNIYAILIDRELYLLDSNANLLEIIILEGNIFIEQPQDIYSSGGVFNIVTKSKTYSVLIEPHATIHNVLYSDNYCFDNTHLCTNSVFIENNIGFDMYCNDDFENCNSGSCVNEEIIINNDTVIEGSCVFTGCESECGNPYITECLNSYNQRSCGQYDDDPCLEWSPVTTCLDNQVCSIDSCKDINYSQYGTYFTYPSHIVSIRPSNDTSIKYIYNTENILTIKSPYIIHNQEYLVQTNPPSINLYGNVNCDYDELIYLEQQFSNSNDDLPNFINTTGLSIELIPTSGEYGINFKNEEVLQTSPISGLMIFENDIIIKDFNKNNVYSILYGGENYNYLNLFIVHDKNTKVFTFYKNSVSPENLLFEIDSYTGSGTDTSLNNIMIRSTFNVQVGLVDVFVRAYFDDGIIKYDQEIQATPFNILDEEATFIDRISFDSNEDSYMSRFKIYKPNELINIIDIDDKNNILDCSFTSNGCYHTRFYGLSNDILAYNNYVDKQICVVLGDDLQTTTEEGDVKKYSFNYFVDKIRNMSLPAKIFLMITVLGVTAFAFFGIERENQELKFVGFGLMALEIFLFVFIGLIPFWIIFLVVILVAMVATKLLRMIFFGGG